jgi:hypothetical protein
LEGTLQLRRLFVSTTCLKIGILNTGESRTKIDAGLGFILLSTGDTKCLDSEREDAERDE